MILRYATITLLCLATWSCEPANETPLASATCTSDADCDVGFECRLPSGLCSAVVSDGVTPEAGSDQPSDGGMSDGATVGGESGEGGLGGVYATSTESGGTTAGLRTDGGGISAGVDASSTEEAGTTGAGSDGVDETLGGAGSQAMSDVGGIVAGDPNGDQSPFAGGNDISRADGGNDGTTSTDCDNGIADGAETGLDCGGPCPACGPGAYCVEDADCASQRCEGAVCRIAACTITAEGCDGGDDDCDNRIDEGHFCPVLTERCEAGSCTTAPCRYTRFVLPNDGFSLVTLRLRGAMVADGLRRIDMMLHDGLWGLAMTLPDGVYHYDFVATSLAGTSVELTDTQRPIDETNAEGLNLVVVRCLNDPVESEEPNGSCDGEDDDADGFVDEGLANACGGCEGPIEERCNRVDDDCDRVADEGLDVACVPECVDYSSDPQCDSLNPCLNDTECIRGACRPIEVCNGLDDDCDGNIDNGSDEALCGHLAELNVAGELSCSPLGRCGWSGNGNDGNRAGCTEGWANADGNPNNGCECFSFGREDTEICSGRDDNCDGLVDGVVGNEAAFASLCSGLPASVQSAVCGGLEGCVIETCLPGRVDVDGDVSNGCECTLRPADNAGPAGTEVCNGLDDDCDGVRDNGDVCQGIDYCRLESPLRISAVRISDDDFDDVEVLVAVYEFGLTDQTTDYDDTTNRIVVEVGYGPMGVHPDDPRWVWNEAEPLSGDDRVPNPNDQDDAQNDIYSGLFDAPAPGTYSVAARVFVDSIDGGAQGGDVLWTYCDADNTLQGQGRQAQGGSVDGFDLSEAAVLEVTAEEPAATDIPEEDDLYITEIMANTSSFGGRPYQWFEVYNASDVDLNLENLEIENVEGQIIEISERLMIQSNRYMVFGYSGDEAENGGYVPDYVYGSASPAFKLKSSNERLTIRNQNREDLVTMNWDVDGGSGFETERRKSLQLRPNFHFGDAEDCAENQCLTEYSARTSWCFPLGTSVYGATDLGALLGTPGDQSACID